MRVELLSQVNADQAELVEQLSRDLEALRADSAAGPAAATRAAEAEATAAVATERAAELEEQVETLQVMSSSIRSVSGADCISCSKSVLTKQERSIPRILWQLCEILRIACSIRNCFRVHTASRGMLVPCMKAVAVAQEELAATAHLRRQVADQAAALSAADAELERMRAAADVRQDTQERATAALQMQLEQAAAEVRQHGHVHGPDAAPLHSSAHALSPSLKAEMLQKERSLDVWQYWALQS